MAETVTQTFKVGKELPVAFDDVIVNFTQEEWHCLNDSQRTLYWDVMLETFRNMACIARTLPSKPDAVTKAEQTEQQWATDHQPSNEEYLSLEDKKGYEELQDQTQNSKDKADDDKVSPAKDWTGKSPPFATARSMARISVFPASWIGSFRCHICGKCFKTRSHLHSHQLVHNPKWTYNCNQCGKSFRSPRTVGYHKRIHLGEKPFYCTLCGKTYCDPSGLSRHNRVHLGHRPHPCPVCGKSFRDQSELKRHQKTHQGQEPVAEELEGVSSIPDATGRFQMSIQQPMAGSCAHSSRTQESLNKTQTPIIRKQALVVSSEKSGFRTKSPMTQTQPSIVKNQKTVTRNQIISVRSQAPLVATQGSVPMIQTLNTRISSLETRSNPHPGGPTKRKIFSCPRCPFTCSKKAYLISHQKAHPAQQQHSCFHCGESVSSFSRLIKHQQTHWEQKVYRCPICDLCFGEKEDLMGHWQSKGEGQHLDNPHKCQAVLGQLLGFVHAASPPVADRQLVIVE